MAEIEKDVSVVISFAQRMMIRQLPILAWPTTSPKRRNMITPRIVKVLGVKTPPKVPNFAWVFGPGLGFGSGSGIGLVGAIVLA